MIVVPELPAAWIDEQRSDRTWFVLFAGVVSAVVTVVTATLLMGAILATGGSTAARWIVGGVFGLGFSVLFGACTVHFAKAWFRGTVRVVVDTTGVRIGNAHTPWPRIRRVVFHDNGTRTYPRGTFMMIQVGRFKTSRVPGIFCLSGGVLADSLAAFLDEHGIAVPVEGRVRE